MRSTHSTLTIRGSSLLAAGVATGVGAVLLGEIDLLRIAVAISLLVLMCWAWTSLCRLQMHTSHRVDRPAVPVGSPVEVEIFLTARSPIPLSSLECTDHTGDDVGAKPTLAVTAASARSGVSMRYTCVPKTRGRHRIGPLAVGTTDAFGLATATTTGTEYIDILGLPVIEDLGDQWSGRGWALAGGGQAIRDIGVDGQLDTSLREHQQHDGLRRVHWRSSARQGKLMVRQDEQRNQRHATILIDDREHVHNRATFDQLISAAASVGVHLLDSGYRLTSYASSGRLAPDSGGWMTDDWLRALALAEASPTATLSRLADAPDGGHETGPVFLLITAASAPGTALLSRAVDRAVPATAIVVEPSSGDVTPDDVLRQLSDHHWRVVVVPAGSSLTDSLAAAGGRR